MELVCHHRLAWRRVSAFPYLRDPYPTPCHLLNPGRSICPLAHELYGRGWTNRNLRPALDVMVLSRGGQVISSVACHHHHLDILLDRGRHGRRVGRLGVHPWKPKKVH